MDSQENVDSKSQPESQISIEDVNGVLLQYTVFFFHIYVYIVYIVYIWFQTDNPVQIPTATLPAPPSSDRENVDDSKSQPESQIIIEDVNGVLLQYTVFFSYICIFGFKQKIQYRYQQLLCLLSLQVIEKMWMIRSPSQNHRS